MLGFALMLGAAPAYPCANLVTTEGELATSDTQEVLFEKEGEASVVEYRVAYQGDAADFGWIIALDGEFEALVDGDVARFDALREASDPQVTYWEDDTSDSGPSLGCRSKAGGTDRVNSLSDTGSGSWEVVAEGFSGTYAYTVIQADDPAGLSEWLTEAGFDASASQDTLDTYLQEGAQMVLVRVNPDAAETPSEGAELPPVRITYAGEFSFPARMARESSATEMATTVYVLGEQRAQVSGWAQTDVDYLDGSDVSAEQLWYTSLLALGLNKGYGRVYAGEYEGAFLTRFETRAPTDVHDVDPVFTVDDGDQAFRASIDIWGATPSSEGWMLLPLLGLGLGLIRRRRA